MKNQLYLFLFSLFSLFLISTITQAQFIEVYSGALTPVYASSAVWGDYNGDGRLDIILTGTSGAYVSKIYRNTGAGFVEDYPGSLMGTSYGSAAWGDYDNDGKPDILLTGGNGSANTRIYHNTGSGFSLAYSPVGVWHSAAAWGDYNNDGKLDFIETGASYSSYVSMIYKNTGTGFIEEYAGSITPIVDGSVAWGDFDNDGMLDLIITGSNASSLPVTKLYRNTGHGFIEAYAGTFINLMGSSVAWGDYDNDGKLDLVIAGYDGSYQAKIYHNTGSEFVEAYAGSLTGLATGSVAWGDYDNDGKLDILICGSDGTTRYTKIYRNTGSGFTEVFSGTLRGVAYSSVAWGDYGNDGKLDILLTGNSSTGAAAKIYQNGTATANTAPLPPGGLSATAGNDTVCLQWNPGSDGETPTEGLTYNLRLGTGSMGIDVQSPLANLITGWRFVPQIGRANQNTSWTIRDLPNGTYYWSVQSIDHTFAGSEFAAEQSFTIMPGFSPAPTAVTFDTVLVGSSKIDSITITNTGNDTLTISGITHPDSRYEVSPTSGVIPTSASLKFYITFTPDTVGTIFDTLTFTDNASGSPHVVYLSGKTGWPTVSTVVQSKWNMLSVPVQTENTLKTFLYPTATSQAFAYDNGYDGKETLKTGKGYWMKFNAAQSVSITGQKFFVKTIDVAPGWNLIGTLSTTIPVEQITSNPPGMITSPFFAYKEGYSATDSLFPGMGYWVKVEEEGTITLSDILLSKRRAESRIRIVASGEQPPLPPSGDAEMKTDLIPSEYKLEQAYPNPFNPLTVIRYQLPVNSYVTIRIYDMLGKELLTLANEIQEAGYKSVTLMQPDFPAASIITAFKPGHLLM